MSFSFLRFTLAFMVTQQVSSLPLACSYNETLYSEGESVATEEACLSCVCRKGSLACSLRVCAEPPEPLPEGCFLVHRPDDCCPRLLCGCFVNNTIYAEGSAVAGSQLCEYCYCIQGEVKCIKPRCHHPFHGCTPLYEGSSCCPTHFDCREVAAGTSTTPKTLGCETEGVLHSEGELVESSNSSKCESCYCLEGKIKCAPIECSMGAFDNCRPLISPDHCCPTSFSCDKNHPQTGNYSVKSLPTLKTKEEILKSEGEYKSTERSPEATRGQDSENTTTEENCTEGSTMPTETEATTPLISVKAEEESENFTTFGFQVIKFQNNSNELTVAMTAETTSEPETTSLPDVPDHELSLNEKKDVFHVNIQTKVDFADQRGVLANAGLEELEGIIGNSSQDFRDDYDSYDYTEPKLPPSLPNLVIFPFVAADAVVKGDNTSKLETYGSNSLKRIDTHEVFYKDYFSPPAKTEGGFVPKEPARPGDNSFYGNKESSSSVKEHTKIEPPKLKKEKCYSEGREVEHGEVVSEVGDCVSCACLHGSIVCQAVTCPKLEPGCKWMEEKPSSSCCRKIACGPGPFDVEKPDGSQVGSLGPVASALGTTPPPSDAPSESPLDLLLTSDSTTFLFSRETKPVTVAYKNVIVDYYPDYLITRNNIRTKNGNEKPGLGAGPPKGFVSVTSPAGFLFSDLSSLPPEESATETPTTAASSFFDEFFKNFLSDDAKSTTRTVPKHKYSSKIKSPVTTTAGPNVEDVTQDAKQAQSASSYSGFPSDSERAATSPRTKATKKGQSEPAALDPPPEASAKEQDQQLRGAVTNLASFLKLAGCNIYGRMYRVGKIIIELSGPCLECVCTDFGVQCKPLIC